jgi:hypothetical protein
VLTEIPTSLHPLVRDRQERLLAEAAHDRLVRAVRRRPARLAALRRTAVELWDALDGTVPPCPHDLPRG